MARTNKDLRKTRHVRTATQKRRDSSRKYCKYRRHIWVYADWPHDMTPRRVLAAMEVDTTGVDPREPLERSYVETDYSVDLDFGMQAVRDKYAMWRDRHKRRTCRDQFCGCRGYTPLGAA